MEPGPYIVTTKRRAHPEPRPEGAVMLLVSRVAVTTLEDLDPYIKDEFLAGRSVVTEPNDGTVIEVKPTTWRDLLPDRLTGESLARLRWAERGDVRAQQRILDAFNAQEAKR